MRKWTSVSVSQGCDRLSQQKRCGRLRRKSLSPAASAAVSLSSNSAPPRSGTSADNGHDGRNIYDRQRHWCARKRDQGRRSKRQAGDPRLLGRHRDRMVRLLPLRLAGRDHHGPVLFGCERDHRLHLRAAGVRGGLCGSAVRGHRVRSAGRSVGAQEHLSGDHAADGAVDLRGGPLAALRRHRHRRADHPGADAPDPGSCAGRRVRWCGHLRRRARAAWKARLLHLLHPDHRHGGPGAEPRRHPGGSLLGGRGSLRRLGLAHPVPGLDPAAGRVSVDPAEAGGEPVVQADEG